MERTTPQNYEQGYLDLLQELVDQGIYRDDRTGTGTYSLFGKQIRHNFSHGFPLLTTKKVFWRGAFEELFWMLSGSTNAKELQGKGIGIWDAWADDGGDLGPIYGEQWRNFGGVDQIKELEYNLRNHPNSRRHVVSAWNPPQLPEMALPPCHCLFQFYVAEGRLSCQLYQRSADIFLGVPFNAAGYGLLLKLLSSSLRLVPGEFVHTFGDVHLYANHLDAAKEQLRRSPRKPPWVNAKRARESVLDYTIDDIEVHDYSPLPSIKAPVAV